jgi:hypothetical protein
MCLCAFQKQFYKTCLLRAQITWSGQSFRKSRATLVGDFVADVILPDETGTYVFDTFPAQAYLLTVPPAWRRVIRLRVTLWIACLVYKCLSFYKLNIFILWLGNRHLEYIWSLLVLNMLSSQLVLRRVYLQINGELYNNFHGSLEKQHSMCYLHFRRFLLQVLRFNGALYSAGHACIDV